MALISRPIPRGLRPPYAEETADSRIGLQTGLLGAENVTRTWRVYCANRTDNPVQVLSSLGSKNGGARTGEIYPKAGSWGDGSYVLAYFTIIDHWIGTSVWIVMGTYWPSYLIGLATNLWTFDIDSSMETERVFTDLNGKGVGPPAYKLASTIVSDPLAEFRADTPDRETITLKLVGGDQTNAALPRYMEGMDRGRRTSTLVFSKTIGSWSPYAQAISSALNIQKATNNGDFTVNTTSGSIQFLSNVPENQEKMLLVSFRLNPIDPSQVSTAAGPVVLGTGPAFRVTVTFKFDPDGHKYKRRHTWKSPDGNWEAPIYRADGSGFMDEEFERYGSTSLTALMGSFV